MNKIHTLKAAQKLQKGGLIAHNTATLAGIAASVQSDVGVRKAQTFKQRKAPFLVVADSMSTALKQAVYISPSLRKLAKQSWPGAVTLVFSAKQKYHAACYQNGFIAIRVDADAETRRLAKLCGGLMLSSSLNRKGQAVQQPNLKQRYRWQRHLSGVLSKKVAKQGKPSKIFRLKRRKVEQLR